MFTGLDYHVIARSRPKGGDVAIPRLEGKCIEKCPVNLRDCHAGVYTGSQ